MNSSEFKDQYVSTICLATIRQDTLTYNLFLGPNLLKLLGAYLGA